MRHFKELKSSRFKSSTHIHFKWGSVLVRLLSWRERRRLVYAASLGRTRSSEYTSFWKRSGHPSFVGEAPEDQSMKESMGNCWGKGKAATLRSKSSPQSLVRRRQNGQGHPSLGTTSDEGLRRGPPTVQPRTVRRPTCDPAHCNGPCVAAVCYGPHL
jgi:hypothetical protein